MSERNKAYAKAQKYALLLLKIRPRSVSELREKLIRKQHLIDSVDEVIAKLIDYGYLNDAEFARAWINGRLSARYGIGRIERELKQKGLCPDLIEQSLDRALEDYDEVFVVQYLIARRLKRYSNLEPLKVKKRLYDFLLRRGFTYGAIKKALDTVEL